MTVGRSMRIYSSKHGKNWSPSLVASASNRTWCAASGSMKARYEDELLRYVVDVDDAPENEQFFVRLKATLLERFDQIEIYVASYLVDIL
jgi:hypothetical protein